MDTGHWPILDVDVNIEKGLFWTLSVKGSRSRSRSDNNVLEKLSDNNKVLLSCHHREIHYIEMHRAKMREKDILVHRGTLGTDCREERPELHNWTNNKLTTSKGRVLKKYQINSCAF